MAESGYCLFQLEPLRSVNALCSRAPSISLNKSCHIRSVACFSSSSSSSSNRGNIRNYNEKNRGHSQPIIVQCYNDYPKGVHKSSNIYSLFSMMSSPSPSKSSTSPSILLSLRSLPSSSPSPSTSALHSSLSLQFLSSSTHWASSLIPSPSSSSSQHLQTASRGIPRSVKDEHTLFHDREFSALAHQTNSEEELLSDNVLRHFLRKCKWEVSLATRKGLMVFIIITTFLSSPSIVLTHEAFHISDGVALAQPTSQIRQLALFLERLAEGNASSRLIDRVVTVISGQTVVTPETVEQLKSVINGEKDLTDLKADLADNSEDFWLSVVDMFSNMDPLSLIDSAGTSIQGLFEVAAERFAAFELSTLVSLGERWLIWTPFVMIPMLWQMSRNNENDRGDDPRKTGAAVELSAEAQAKALKVKEELERMELKSTLLDMVSRLGKLAWRSSNTDQGQMRKEIDRVLERLQQLNPCSPTSIDNDNLMSTSNVDGDWMLIYVSEVLEQSRSQQLLDFPNLDVFGVEISDMRQKVWQKPLRVSVSTLDEDDEAGKAMKAKNTGKVRLGPLGVVEVSAEGTWRNLSNSNGAAFVSFQTLSARPIEILGSHLREDLPPLAVSIPQALQTSGQWETVYLDKSIRINRGSGGRTFVFRKVF